MSIDQDRHVCRYCGKAFDTARKLGGHVSRCSKRPGSNELFSRIGKTNTEKANIKKHIVVCENCGKTYEICCSDREFEAKRYKKTCSKTCAHLLTIKKTDKDEKNSKISKSCSSYDSKSGFSFDEWKIIKDHEYKLKKKANSQNHNRDCLPFHFRKIEPGQCWFCGHYECHDEFCRKISFQHVIMLIRNFGFDSMKLCSDDAKPEYDRIRGLLRHLYYDQKMSINMIAKHFSIKTVNSTSLYDTFIKMCIPIRNQSQATSNAILEGRLGQGITSSLQFHTSYHQSWDGYTYFMRSSFETDFAKELDNKKIHYKVESLRIKYFDSQVKKERIAIPDFYLPFSNEIVEIKSSVTLDLQNMKDKFEAYKNGGYKPRLILNHCEVDLYNIENEVSEKELLIIKSPSLFET